MVISETIDQTVDIGRRVVPFGNKWQGMSIGNKCIIKTGNVKYNNLFESGSSKQINGVLNRIFDN